MASNGEQVSKVKQLVASLEGNLSNEARVQSLQSMYEVVINMSDDEAASIHDLLEFKVYKAIDAVLNDNLNTWVKNFPTWVAPFMHWLADQYVASSLATVNSMFNVVRSYILNECWASLYCLQILSSFDNIKQSMYQDNMLYQSLILKVVLKEAVDKPHGITIFRTLKKSNEKWQRKLLEDKQFITNLSILPESSGLWILFLTLSQHPDAKTLLPSELLTTASKSNDPLCVDLCAILCSDDNLGMIKLNDDWIQRKATLLETLLAEGRASHGVIFYNLLDLVLPIANLSIVEAKKDVLGKHFIPLLLRVITEKNLPQTPYVTGSLPRGLQEAAKAIWNFAYLESNRALISQHDMISKLEQTLASATDSIFKKNIEGILFMFSPPPKPVQSVPAKDVIVQASKAKHIMLSYNWGDQPTILRIAKSLKENGFQIWLDVERMAGSTLEAMSEAVEQADLVLVCMSQKYKDSPNCRLEGEYCVVNKVPIVPLMMQQGYRPDGWLGITLGSKLWYDFSDAKNYDSKFGELIKAIGDRGKGVTPPSPLQTIPVVPNPNKQQKPLLEWDIEDVREWMKAADVERPLKTFKEHKFDGRALAELKRLHSHQPKLFHLVCHQLGISKCGEMLRLSAAIHKL